ncbi:MAG: YheV family putative zinc ribbon protein [Pseudomonadales bacterium]
MTRARFIAGAVCPACGAMDRLQVFGEGDARRRRCVSCGHEDTLPATASQSPRSRLDAAAKPADAEAVRRVRILSGPSNPIGDKDRPSDKD